MNEKYDSLLEIAVAIMKRKKKPQTIESLIDEVFARKGIEKNEQDIAQFEVDFMLSGYFVYFGEDEDNKKQLWDLKERQKSSYLDKDAGVAELNEYDEEAESNALGNDNTYADTNVGDYLNDDDDVEKTDEEDIKEELGLVGVDTDTSEMDSEEMSSSDYFDDSDEEEINEDEEEDDIEEALRKQRKNK